MFKKLLSTIFLLGITIAVLYPSKIENTEIFNYCYSLEKILFRNSISKRKSLPKIFKSISKDITNFGVRKTQGFLVNKVIDKYKISKNNFVIDILPNNFYCLTGYWIEKLKPGIFESVFYVKTKKVINDFGEFNEDLDEFINELNLEYENLKNQFNRYL